VYADFQAAHDDALVDLATEYDRTLTTAQQRDYIGSYIRLNESELRTLRRVQNGFDRVWRDDTDTEPYGGLSDTVVAFVEEYADGF